MKPTESAFPPGSVVVITGIMGAGKSTVAQRLAESLPRAVHVRGDLFRRMIVTGRAEMVPGAGSEALSQLRLRYALATQAVDGYAGAGFSVVYQDIILGDDLVTVTRRIRSRPLFVVVLAPRPEVALRRAEARSKVSGCGEWTPNALDQLLRATPRLGLWLNTSEQTVEETADEIRSRIEEARIGLTVTADPVLDRTWPPDWEERKAGRGCPMCEEGRAERVPDGERVAEGMVTASYLLNRADAPGYVMCVWRGRHAAEITELDGPEAAAFWQELRSVARAVEASCTPAKLNIQILGNSVPHLHAHIVPRYVTDPTPGGPPHFLTDDAPPLEEKTFRDLKARIMAHMHDRPSEG